MPLSPELVGPQANGAWRFRPAGREAVHRYNGKFRVLPEKGRHCPFIFLGGEGAGGVHSRPPGATRAAAASRISPCRRAHMSTRAGLQSARAAASFRNMPSPEQGGVYQNPVKPTGQRAGPNAGAFRSALGRWPRPSVQHFGKALPPVWNCTRCTPVNLSLGAWLPAGWPCRQGRRTDPAPAYPAPAPAAPPGPWRWAPGDSIAPPRARGAGRAALPAGTRSRFPPRALAPGQRADSVGQGLSGDSAAGPTALGRS